jgi:hypothetical protein
MRLALGIAFLWSGVGLLTIAFHPLPVESGTPGPGQVIHALQAKVAQHNSAYEATGTTRRANPGESSAPFTAG